jgi:Flp pilus assembly protein TadB
MRVSYAYQGAKTGPDRLWGTLIRLAVIVLAAAALLAITLIGLFIVLPLMLVGGIALHFYLRRRMRRALWRQSEDGVIDAEYTVIERH